jgi:hypothetical protein
MGRTVFADLPDGACGYYDNTDGRVYVHKGLSRTMKRCTEVHEAIHKEFQHGPVDTEPERVSREIAVERLTARQLIVFPSLMTAMSRFPKDPVNAARYLQVDLDVYLSRILGLTHLEQVILEVCCGFCIGRGTAQAARQWPMNEIKGGRVPLAVA